VAVIRLSPPENILSAILIPHYGIQKFFGLDMLKGFPL
jgi:hypothetical protein